MNEDLYPTIRETRETTHVDALALGFLRYEALRKLQPRELLRLWQRNMKGENFDQMIDDLIPKKQ